MEKNYSLTEVTQGQSGGYILSYLANKAVCVLFNIQYQDSFGRYM